MIQLQVLNRVLTDRSLNLLLNNGLGEEHFTQYTEEYEFITSHYDKYGNVPDDETMLNKFPDFQLLDVGESHKYLAETLHEEHLYHLCVPVLNKAAELLQSNAQDAVSYIVPKFQELMKKHSYSAGVDIMKNTDERFNEMMSKRDMKGMLGISSGMAELDEILGGWLPGEELVTVVGRVNQGKSWILLYFLAMAWNAGKRVLLYSGEMGDRQVGYRTDTLISHFSNRAISRGTLDDSECELYRRQLKEFESKDVPFIVVTPKDLGGKRLTAPMLDSLIDKYKPDLVGVDQISLMDDARSNRDVLRVQLTHIAEDLFRLSEKHGIPVIADAQANRKSHDKDTPEAPELTEIGESDGIGQYSSRVISLVQAPSGLKLSIKKNRYGANNMTLCYCWDIDKGTFTYLPTVDGEDASSAPNTELQARNRRGRQEQQEQFSDGSDVF